MQDDRRAYDTERDLGLSGRFAPSPTGPLHMGSLVAALASYCDIKQRGGRWFLRIDDIDPARTDQQSIEQITQTLTVHGLIADAPLRRQSRFTARYANALRQLIGECFFCRCARSELRGQRLYPGRCRANKEKQPNHAIRLRADRQRRFFTDALQGSYHFIPAEDFGDVVIWRKEDLVTYHLATACDDAMDYSHVLRGDDLFAMTAPQVYIMDRLGLSPPQYAHIPVLTFADGTKLSKQTHAPALDNTMPEANIRTALDFLGQTPPATKLTVNQWIDWAVTHWRLQAVPSQLKPYVASDLD